MRGLLCSGRPPLCRPPPHVPVRIGNGANSSSSGSGGTFVACGGGDGGSRRGGRPQGMAGLGAGGCTVQYAVRGHAVPRASGRGRLVAAACLAGRSGGDDMTPSFAGKRQRRNRRSPKPDSLAPSPLGTAGGSTSGLGLGGGAHGSGGAGGGPAPSPVSSPVPPPTPSGGSASAGGGSAGSGVVATAAATATAVLTTVAPPTSSTSPSPTSSVDGGSLSDYESALPGGSQLVGNHIVPFARRQPRALVLDCAYRPINVLTWYRAFHFDYFGKGEVLEYYPPPAVCTTGSGDYPLPAVLRVPQYTADMQDLCSRVACSRRNIMVRDGFCCQYCGSRRDLTIDHVHPVSKGGKETWENLVTACMKCNQRKSDRTLRELGWKLRRQPKEPTPFEIGIVAGISTSDILRPPPEWEAYIAPYRERLEMYRKAAVEAGLLNLIDDG